MYKLVKAEIENFWEKYKLENTFYKDVNIFIGDNGTGKTTFINIVQAVLTVNLDVLNYHQFSSVKLDLEHENRKVKIIVKKDDDNLNLTYKINEDEYEMLNVNRDNSFVRYNNNMNQFISEVHMEVYNKITAMVNLGLLTVSRQINERNRNFRGNYIDSMDILNTVDDKLNNLIEKFMSYKLSLELKIKNESTKFEKEVLKSLLFDEKVDKLDFKLLKGGQKGFTEEKNGLIKAYENLNILDEEISKKIDVHMNAIKKTYENYNSGKIEVEDVFPVALLARTEHLIHLTMEIEKNKKEIYKPLDKFQEVITKFMKNKKIKYSSNRFVIFNGKKVIDIRELSSGEKQLLILLIESLLQKNKPSIFIADEPELSLHITWQEQIILAIRELNSNAQIIVATHSPEIAGSYPDRIRDMEEILNVSANS